MSALGCIGLGPATHFHSSDFSAFLSASSSFLRERFECAPCIASHSSRSLACARAEWRWLSVGAREGAGGYPAAAAAAAAASSARAAAAAHLLLLLRLVEVLVPKLHRGLVRLGGERLLDEPHLRRVERAELRVHHRLERPDAAVLVGEGDGAVLDAKVPRDVLQQRAEGDLGALLGVEHLELGGVVLPVHAREEARELPPPLHVAVPQRLVGEARARHPPEGRADLRRDLAVRHELVVAAEPHVAGGVAGAAARAELLLDRGDPCGERVDRLGARAVRGPELVDGAVVLRLLLHQIRQLEPQLLRRLGAVVAAIVAVVRHISAKRVESLAGGWSWYTRTDPRDLQDLARASARWRRRPRRGRRRAVRCC